MSRTSLVIQPPAAGPSQWLFTPAQVANNPSVRGGLARNKELDGRAKGVRRLFDLKDALQIPQIVVSTAAAYLHRFYMKESMQEYQPETAAAAAFFLACKVEESPRRLRDVVQATLSFNSGRSPRFDEAGRILVNDQDPAYPSMRSRILYYEEAMLRAIAFDLTIMQPQWLLIKASGKIWTLKDPRVPDERQPGVLVSELGWSLLNDVLPTTILLLHKPETIATSAFVLACAQLRINIPSYPEEEDEDMIEEGEEREEKPYWLEVFDVQPSEVQNCLGLMIDGYRRAKSEWVRNGMATIGKRAISEASKLKPMRSLEPPVVNLPPLSSPPTPLPAPSITPVAPIAFPSPAPPPIAPSPFVPSGSISSSLTSLSSDSERAAPPPRLSPLATVPIPMDES